MASDGLTGTCTHETNASINTSFNFRALVQSFLPKGQDWGPRDGGIAAIFAFVAAYAALHVMVLMARSISFTPYVIYRLALGGFLLAYFGLSAT